MRHKIMLALEDMQAEQPATVEDVVEADETYVPESNKVQSLALMPVESPAGVVLPHPSVVGIGLN